MGGLLGDSQVIVFLDLRTQPTDTKILDKYAFMKVGWLSPLTGPKSYAKFLFQFTRVLRGMDFWQFHARSGHLG